MNNKLHCFNKLEELFSLYDKVKQAVILLENFKKNIRCISLLSINFGAHQIIYLKPQLTDIKSIVAKLRSDKKIDSDKSFSAYFDQISILINIDQKIDTMIPSLDEFEKKKKKEKLKIWGISILSSIISGLAVGVIMFFMTK